MNEKKTKMMTCPSCGSTIKTPNGENDIAELAMRARKDKCSYRNARILFKEVRL